MPADGRAVGSSSELVRQPLGRDSGVAAMEAVGRSLFGADTVSVELVLVRTGAGG